MRVLGIIVALALAGCAGKPLAKEQREWVFVEQTNLKQAEAHGRGLAYLAKNLGDSNHAIKVNDAANGSVITRIAVLCNEMRGALDLADYHVTYNLEYSSKDNRVRLAYEALEFMTTSINGDTWGPTSISTESQSKDAKICAERSKSEILAALKTSKTDW